MHLLRGYNYVDHSGVEWSNQSVNAKWRNLADLMPDFMLMHACVFVAVSSPLLVSFATCSVVFKLLLLVVFTLVPLYLLVIKFSLGHH
jgi:hypothetical protein